MITDTINLWANEGLLDEEMTLIQACILKRPAEVGKRLKAMTGEYRELIAHQFLETCLMRQSRKVAPTISQFKSSLQTTMKDGRFQSNVWSYLDILSDIGRKEV